MRSLASGETARVYLALLLLTSADGLVSTIASPFLQSLGYPLADIGVLVSAYAIASLASRLPAGRLAEGRHPHAWLVVAGLAYAAALALYPMAVVAWAFWSVRVLHGLAFGTATTLNFAVFLGVSTGTNRARATAFYTASMAAGYATGNFASGFLADHFGYGVAFTVAALAPLGALLVSKPAATISAPLATTGPVPSAWRTLLHPEVRAVPILAFSVNFVNQTLSTLFPLYVLSIGQTLSVAGTARGLQSLSNVIVRPFGGLVVRRLGPVALGSVGAGLAGSAFALVPLTTAPPLLLTLFAVAGVGRAGGVLANAMSTVELSERGVLKRGTASALITAGGDAGAIAAPIVAGAVAGRIGLGPALTLLPLVGGLLGIAGLLAGRPGGRRGA